MNDMQMRHHLFQQAKQAAKNGPDSPEAATAAGPSREGLRPPADRGAESKVQQMQDPVGQ